MSETSPTISAIFRYPVKGLSPQRLPHTRLEVGATLPADRLYAIENGPSGFDPAAPAYFPKIRFLMLMRNARLAELRTAFDNESHLLTIRAENREAARGNLRTPEALIDAMWAARCIHLETPTALRVTMLMQEYDHFVRDPAALGNQLDCLVSLHGHERINQWKAMSVAGDDSTMVRELLELHNVALGGYLQSKTLDFQPIFDEAMKAASQSLAFGDHTIMAIESARREKLDASYGNLELSDRREFGDKILSFFVKKPVPPT